MRVWIGIGASLAAGGTRVMLVTAVGGKCVERSLPTRGIDPSLRFGAMVTWQTVVPLGTLVDERAERGAIKQIIVSSRPRRVPFATDVEWIILPENAWTSAEPDLAEPSATRLTFPLGLEENRGAAAASPRAMLVVMAPWKRSPDIQSVCCAGPTGRRTRVIASPIQNQGASSSG